MKIIPKCQVSTQFGAVLAFRPPMFCPGLEAEALPLSIQRSRVSRENALLGISMSLASSRVEEEACSYFPLYFISFVISWPLWYNKKHIFSLWPWFHSQMALVVKNPPTNGGRHKRHGFNPWVRKIPCRRKWQPTPIFLPGESHGQRSLVGYSP